MTDDDAHEAHRDGQGMVRHHSDPLDGATLRPVPLIAAEWCGWCFLLHAVGMPCGEARAVVEAETDGVPVHVEDEQ